MSDAENALIRVFEDAVKDKYEEAKRRNTSLEDAAKSALDEVYGNAFPGTMNPPPWDKGQDVIEPYQKIWRWLGGEESSQLVPPQEEFLRLMEQKLLTFPDHPEMWDRRRDFRG